MPRQSAGSKDRNDSSVALFKAGQRSDRLAAMKSTLKGLVPSRTDNELQRKDLFLVFVDRIISEERSVNTKTRFVVHATTVKPLFYKGIENVSVDFTEVRKDLVLQTLNENQNMLINTIMQPCGGQSIAL